jgi:hypothetical protein
VIELGIQNSFRQASTIDSSKTRRYGKKDYKGTILDGRDSFDSWRMDLDDSSLSDDLMSYVTAEATADKSAADIKNTSLARMKYDRVSIKPTRTR